MGAVSLKSFCDDGAKVISGPCPNTLVELMQQAINLTMEFGSQENLIFNPKKTKAKSWQLKLSKIFICYNKSRPFVVKSRFEINLIINLKNL